MEDIIQRLIYVPDYLASGQNLRDTLKTGTNDRKERRRVEGQGARRVHAGASGKRRARGGG